MVNPTMTKFGYPGTEIRAFRHWSLLLRPAQATFGAMILACREDATSFAAISDAAFAELPEAIRAIEHKMASFLGYQKLNYLMLMMVDPHVHYHVLPRYDAPKEFSGASFTDPGWPGAPQIAHANAAEEATMAALLAAMRRAMTA